MDSDYFQQLLNSIIILPFTGENVLFLLLAFLSLLFSAYISASELAYFSLDNRELQTLKLSNHPIDQKINNLLKYPEQLLTSLSIVNVVANIAFIVFSYHFCIKFFDVHFLLLLGFLLLPLLLFGKMIPKLYASQYPLMIVHRWVYTITRLNKLFAPISHVLIWITTRIGNKFSLSNYNISFDNLSQVFEITGEETSNEKELLKGIVEFGEKTAVEIMTARLDVTNIDIKKDFKDVINLILETGYSRIPVYSESDDFIKGVLYIKDILPHLSESDDFHWQSLIRPAYFVPESKKISSLLGDFRQHKIHLAIVVDEFGGTSGIVSMEDILEEIVGEIRDEYDDEEKQYIVLPDNAYIFQGKILLNDLFKIPEIKEEDFGELGDDSDTLAGLLLELKGDFPNVQEKIDYKNYHFTILEINKQRIVKVKLVIDENLPTS